MRNAVWWIRTGVLSLVLAAACLSSLAQMPANVGGENPLQLGTAWYPEQWPESRWEHDLTLMEEAHIHFVRVGEFAWSRVEPTEGHYDFAWLERAVRDAEKHHIQVVIGTPTAAPPAWLTQKYPETLRVKEDGQRDEHGNRAQFDFSDPLYRVFTRRIAEQLAIRFGHDPNVIGWQIDNEYSHISMSPGTRAQFEVWLKARYGTLDNLNERWTTEYWSQTYTKWSQIGIPKGTANPGLMLCWKRFVSDTWRSYQRNQLEVIRHYADKRQFITTNMMGWYDGFNQYTVAKDLDIAAWDDYVSDGHLDAISNGARGDLTRGLLHKNFWVMETQPGFVTNHPVNNSLNRGEVRAMAWHNVGHGAEAIGYWQWRSALNGQEQYHGTLLGADGTPVPVYQEVKEVGREFEIAGPVLADTTPMSDVAILQSYDSRWAIEGQKHGSGFDPIQALLSYYGPLQADVHAVDIVSPTSNLNRYKLVIAPALNVITDATARNLLNYVRSGGHLVLGQRSGMKDDDNALQVERQPGPLAALLGGRVEQYYALEKPVPFSGAWGTGESRIWAEQLSVTSPDTQVLLRYGKSNGWLDDQPAVVTRQVGHGSITYVGAWLDPNTMRHAVAWMLKNSGVEPLNVKVPEGVELSIRKGDGRTVWILVNLSAGQKTVALPEQMKDVLADTQVQSVSLAQYGVAVLSRSE